MPSAVTLRNPPYSTYAWAKSWNLGLSGTGRSVTVTPTSAGTVWIDVQNSEYTIPPHYSTAVTVGPAIDFILTNNSSHDLESIYIQLTGNVGGSYTTLFNSDPGTLPGGGQSTGFPVYSGDDLTAVSGTPITDLALELWASTYDDELVTVMVSWDQSNPTTHTNMSFGGGNIFYFSPSNTTVPSPSTTLPSVRRRTLNILVKDPYWGI